MEIKSTEKNGGGGVHSFSSYLTGYISCFLYFNKKMPLKKFWKMLFIISATLWRRD